jgi:3-polyprenyl-4-hydroxybenzoate decarboxylase
MATRFQGDQHLLVMPGMLASGLDPSNHGRSLGCKAGFDCTRGMPDDRFATRLEIPRSYMDAQPLSQLASAEAIAAIPQDQLT